MKNRVATLLVFLCALPPLVAEQKQVLSDVYPIVKKYKSMEGPQGTQTVYLGDRTQPELVWLTAIRTEVVGADGVTPASPELMCHMNVDINPERHQALFNLKRFPAARLMTISQGMRIASGAFEARLPKGFGFPMSSSEPLTVMTQVLNLNLEHPKNLNVRHRVTFEYMRDRDLKERPIPVFNLGASGMVQMTDNPIALTAMPAADSGEHHGPSCLIGQRAPNAGGMSADYVDPHGRHMTGHWVVPPGKQVNASDVTWFLNLPYDTTTLHYAVVHLHPFAQSLTLRDTTTNTDVVVAKAKNPKGRLGLDRVDDFVSVPGVTLYKNHNYSLISVYDNPTKQNVDSMASIFLALGDPEFVAPTPAQLVERGVVITNDTALVLRTSDGDIGATLINNPASLQLAKLVAGGAFRNAEAAVADNVIRFFEKQSIAPLSGGGEHLPGSISVCTSNDLVSLVIVTSVAHDLDSTCAVVGTLGPGADVVRSIVASGTGKILRAEIVSGADLNDLHLAPAGKVAAK